MRITIAPTENWAKEQQHPTVTIETTYDDMTIEEMVTLFRDAMLALGFQKSGLDQYFLLDDCEMPEEDDLF
jgi:hypothetical protein